MRLIDADKIMADIALNERSTSKDYILLTIARYIKIQPTIEAEPVRHGRWMHNGFMEVKCNNCGNVFHELEDTNYCPNCGAKMDDDEEDCEEEDNEPKHGHWDIFYNDNIPFSFKCSECGQFTIIATKYCPSCGCKMDLDEVNDEL